MPYKKTVILVLILMIISSVTAMITPLLLRTIIDQVVVSDEYKTLALLISGMAALAVLEIGVTLIHQRLMGVSEQKSVQPVLLRLQSRRQQRRFHTVGMAVAEQHPAVP